jgi:ribonuclease HI
MSELVAYVDGGSHGNPGPSGIGVVIESPSGEKTRIAKSIGHQDNNVAEYVALLEALQHAIAVNARRLRVYSDSQIVVKQMTGEYCASSQSCPAVKSTTSQGSRQSRSAITWLPCLTCFGSGSEPCFAGFGRAAV